MTQVLERGCEFLDPGASVNSRWKQIRKPTQISHICVRHWHSRRSKLAVKGQPQQCAFLSQWF